MRFHTPTYLSNADEFIISEFSSGRRDAVSDRINAILVRTYGRPAVVAILAKRRKALIDDTLTSRRWQSSVSRRPARNAHPDSWETRERFIRGNRPSLWLAPGASEARLLWYVRNTSPGVPSKSGHRMPVWVQEYLAERVLPVSPNLFTQGR